MVKTRLQGRDILGPRSAGLMIVLGMFAASCGDSGGGSDPSRFIGTWTTTAGQLKVACPALPIPVPPNDLTGQKITVTAGTDAPIQSEINGCVVKFDLNGDVATARAGQTCTTIYNTAAGGLTAMLTIASATFTLKTATGEFAQSGNATVALTLPGLPATTSCTYEIAATAARM